ncbi:MAG: HNH endonuclease signature motif containing protein [Elusimicrobiota bacterium]
MDYRLLTDDDLVARLKACVGKENEDVAAVIEHLMEFDRRRLHSREGQPSSFVYCTKVLGYAEGAAYRRIYCARAARAFPSIVGLLREGQIHLEAVALLAPRLDEDNWQELLAWAKGKSCREIEFKVASLAPRPDIADSIRTVPAPPAPSALESNWSLDSALAPAEPAPVLEARAIIKPLSEDRVHFGFTGGKDLLEKIDRAKELLRHKHPHGRLEEVIDELAEAFLDRKDPQRRIERLTRLKRASAPSRCLEETRRIPQRIKDEVWKRDEGRCVFAAADGQRCPAKAGLEFDHIVPWALGGRSHDTRNIRLLCRAHNQLQARRSFGGALTTDRRGGASGRPPANPC